MLAASVLSLVAFGLVMIHSSSTVLAERAFGSSVYFVSRQAAFAMLGVAAMIGLSYVPYRLYRAAAYPILVVALGALVAVVGGAGTTVRGATRWIDLGPVMFEPSEAAKVALVVWLSYSVAKKGELLRNFSVGFVPHALLAGMIGILCLLQPDFGSAAIVAMLTFAILFVAGTRLAYILGTMILALPVVYHLLVSSPYRYQRLVSFLDPWRYRFDEGYQVSESMLAFGSGGITGQGLGQGLQKLFFLPDAHNDFIASIVGEELGLLGVLALIALFALVVARGYRIAARCADPFGAYLAFGLTTLIGLQVLINFGVAMGLLPTKGLTLPFVSYGGSSLMVHMASAGMLLAISREVAAAAPHGAAVRPAGAGENRPPPAGEVHPPNWE